MNRRLWMGLTVIIALVRLCTWAVAAQEAKRTAAVALAPPVVATGRAQLPSAHLHDLRWGRASPGVSTDALFVYLPAVFRGYPGCSTIPTLIQPQNGSTLSTIAPLYVWDDGSDPFATGFRLQVARDPQFSHGAGSVRTSIHGEYEFRFSTNLEPSTTYYWRAYLVCGDERGPYSDVWSFTTGSAGTILPAPVLVAPADGSAVPSTVATLQWSSVPGAVDYLVCWRQVGLGGYNYEWQSGTQQAAYLSNNSTYEWWVSARNDYAIGTDSPKWQLTTGPAPSLP